MWQYRELTKIEHKFVDMLSEDRRSYVENVLILYIIWNTIDYHRIHISYWRNDL